jgi:hypothetical protein
MLAGKRGYSITPRREIMQAAVAPANRLYSTGEEAILGE